ncbi:PorT family protein [bacterium]|nr:PorT family protein [bacterium]
MKKLLLCLFLLIIPFNVFSGISSMGIVGGGNLAKFDNSDSRLGIVAGVSLETNQLLIKNLSLYSEILYSEIGGEQPNNSYKVIYADIPVLLKYSLKLTDNLLPYVKLGPSIGFLAQSQIIKDYPSYDEFKVDNKNNTRSVNLNGVAGCGINFNFAKNICFVEARYLYGYKDLFENKFGENNCIQVIIGYSRPL